MKDRDDTPRKAKDGRRPGQKGPGAEPPSPEQLSSAEEVLAPEQEKYRVTLPLNSPLGNTTASYWSYITSSSSTDENPFVVLAVDRNNNGYDIDDPIIISVSSEGNPTEAW